MRYLDKNGKVRSNAEIAMMGVDEIITKESDLPFVPTITYTAVRRKNHLENDAFVPCTTIGNHRKRIEDILIKACDGVHPDVTLTNVKGVARFVRVYAFSDGSHVLLQAAPKPKYTSKIDSIEGYKNGGEDDRNEPIRITSVSNHHVSIQGNYGTLLRFNVLQEHGEYEGESALWWVHDPEFTPHTLLGWKYYPISNKIIAPTKEERELHGRSLQFNWAKETYDNCPDVDILYAAGLGVEIDKNVIARL
jgi:hypothetical protein